MKSGNFNFLEPSGPLQACNRTALPSFYSTCFAQFLCPSSGVSHCTHSNGIGHTGLLTACEQNQDGTGRSVLILLASCQQTCMTYNIAVCTVWNCWWWTVELSETCGVSFQNKFEKLVHLVGFIIRIFQKLLWYFSSMHRALGFFVIRIAPEIHFQSALLQT